MSKARLAILGALLLVGSFLIGSWSSQRAAGRNGAAEARKILYYVDPMHPAYKSDKPGIAPDCGMQLVSVYAEGGVATADLVSRPSSLPPGTVQIDPEKQWTSGMRVSRVEKTAGTHTLRLLGRVAPDETKIYRLNAAVDGWIRDTYAISTGSLVKKDQPLAAFYSPEFLAAEQAFLYAIGALDRWQASGRETPRANCVDQGEHPVRRG